MIEDVLREALQYEIGDTHTDRALTALRAYAARPDVVERCARALFDYERSTPAHDRVSRMGYAKAALAAFLGETQ